jgi:hypothetical protein
MAWSMAQMAEYLPVKLNTLVSIPRLQERKQHFISHNCFRYRQASLFLYGFNLTCCSYLEW